MNLRYGSGWCKNHWRLRPLHTERDDHEPWGSDAEGLSGIDWSNDHQQADVEDNRIKTINRVDRTLTKKTAKIDQIANPRKADTATHPQPSRSENQNRIPVTSKAQGIGATPVRIRRANCYLRPWREGRNPEKDKADQKNWLKKMGSCNTTLEEKLSDGPTTNQNQQPSKPVESNPQQTSVLTWFLRSKLFVQARPQVSKLRINKTQTIPLSQRFGSHSLSHQQLTARTATNSS